VKHGTNLQTARCAVAELLVIFAFTLQCKDNAA